MTNTFAQDPPERVSADSVLWRPTSVGALQLPHRLAMAPMTRDRSAPDGSPTDLNAEYYRQRASTAMVITEGTQPSADGQGYLLTPGIYTDEHVAGWTRVADAVHQEGGRLIVQLMHVGRISHPDNTPHHRNRSRRRRSPRRPRCSPPGACNPSRAPRAEHRGGGLHRRGLPPRRGLRDARRSRRGRNPRGQRISHTPVLVHQRQPAGRPLRRLGEQPDPVCLRNRRSRRR